MKKLYAFLVVLLGLGMISSENAHAFAITNFVVRTINAPDAQGLGSGANWQSITGTNGNLSSSYDGEQMSAAYQVPFNFQFLNTQITTSNTFRFNNYGTVVFSPTWPSNANYDYGSYDWFYLSEYGTVYDYLPNALYQNEIDYTYGYSYYGNYRLAPFEGFLTYYNSMPGYSVQWTTLGSAPNRELVVQANNVPGYQYGPSPGIAGSWQTVVYEAGISNFQFNYGPQIGTFNQSWGYLYTYGGWLVESYSGYTAVKTTGGNYLTIGWNGNGTDASAQPLVAYVNNYSLSGYYNPNTYGWVAEDNATEAKLPQVSYHVSLPYPYDFSADVITNPGQEQLKAKNVAFTPTIKITNQGTSVPTSLQVNLTMSFINGPQAYNQTVTVPGTSLPGPFTSTTISMPAFTPHDTTIGAVSYLAYNIYEDTATVYNLQPTADQNPADNVTTDEWICSPPNDIKSVAILSPAVGTSSSDRTPLSVATPVHARFRNTGTSSQTNVPLTVVIRDPSGAIEYGRSPGDTIYIPSWPTGSLGGNSDGNSDFSVGGQGPGKGPYYDTAFPEWTPTVVGIHKICAIALLGNDDLRADDTTCGLVLVRPIYDASAIAVVSPQPDEEMPANTTWQPTALFQSTGVSNLFDVPVQVRIYSCSNPNTPVFVADSTMPELNIDQNQVRFSFPSSSGPYNIKNLPPGCYTMCAIVNYPGDGDLTNDTACSQFSIIPELQGDIYVGVGQRFQTIHAALDSMKFRGIGGPLRLILRDANYTENGTYRVSSGNAALDFRGIRDLSSTNTVKWVPYPGVHPTITFTGREPACFYFGDLFGGYMTFEGYNPLGVPVPDKLTAEPTKRGITIVDNETSAGPVFDIEQGASNITLKDLIIHGNGNYGNDSSAAIRIYNDQNQTVFLQAVHDTVPINHIMVNNCELGKAKYGLFDHGLHDMFNLGEEKFIVWRNNSNTFTRNTIGTSTNPLSYAGIHISNEQDLTVSHNEISNINTANAGPTGANWNAFGIESPNPANTSFPSPVQPGDTGNVVRVWLDANRIHNVRATGTGHSYGVAIQQAVTIYTIGSGSNAEHSSLPIVTQNRVTNNMIFDLQSASGSYPIAMTTSGPQYSADLDSVFNNSISTNSAAANIKIQYAKHVFLWNNILQNTSAGPYVNYWLEVPHPFANAISSDYNLFDLRGTNYFDSLTEYDARYGTVLQTRYFRNLNDWRSYVGQDMHSLTGDPMFATGTDSLHMPPALSYIESPASNNGAWLGTNTQKRDFDGDLRLQGNATPDIGADEWDGFQFTNDLAVMSITQPAGFSATSDTSLVTTENPLWITAQVKNLSSQSIFNRTVNATVQQATNGGAWTTIFNSNSAPLTWDVSETKSVVFQGPRLDTGLVHNSVYRIIVSVPNDQDNVNNSQTKIFRVLLKNNAVLVTFNGATPAGIRNADSVELALNRLGVPFDVLDRNAPDGLANSTDLDYSPWWTLIWVSGDPTIAPVSGQATGQAGLSFKETQEVDQYLQHGLSYAKKNLVVAGQNIAYYNGYVMSNNIVTDSEWLQTYMHTRFVANSPLTSGAYNGWIVGQQPAYWKFPDSLNSVSPDVVKPSFATPLVGSEVTGFSYTYKTHPNTPSDSGAGTTYYNTLVNTVFYGFDWSDPVQTTPTDPSTGLGGDTISGTTRTLAAAFAFFRSHGGTLLPVQFVSATAQHENQNALIQWEIAQQENVTRYDVEQQLADGASTSAQPTWVTLGHTDALDNTTKYAFTQANIDVTRSYTYRIAAIDNSGAKTYSNTIELGPDASQMGFTLGQNYPNPSTGSTEVSFTLPVASHVTLRVLDVTGKVVNSDVSNVSFDAGQQIVKLDLGSLANGSYVYELIATGADGQSVTLSKKLTLVK